MCAQCPLKINFYHVFSFQNHALMKPAIIFILILSFFGSALYSQKVLVLDLSGMKTKRIKYQSGDYISVRVVNDKVIYKGYLEVATDSSFFVNDNLVYLDSLRQIIKYNKAPKMISKQAFLVGGITAVISGLNNGLTKGDVFPQDDSYIIPASFLGLGVIFMPFWRKTYDVTKKNRSVKILDLTPSPVIQESP